MSLKIGHFAIIQTLNFMEREDGFTNYRMDKSFLQRPPIAIYMWM